MRCIDDRLDGGAGQPGWSSGPEISATAHGPSSPSCASTARAEAYVTQVTGLDAGANLAGAGGGPAALDPANLDGFRQILAPLSAKAAERFLNAGSTMAGIGPRITGVEVGALLSYRAPKVLGQFDPFFPGGRLLLVAPNIVAIERELDVIPGDFRLWVCLHEETHRVQFAAVPWLRDYLNAQIAELVDSTDLDPTVLAEMLRNAIKRIIDGLVTRSSPSSTWSKRRRSASSSTRSPR